MKTKKQSFFFTYVLIGSIAIYWHASPYNPQLEYNKLEQLIGQELQTKNEENKKEIQKQKEKIILQAKDFIEENKKLLETSRNITLKRQNISDIENKNFMLSAIELLAEEPIINELKEIHDKTWPLSNEKEKEDIIYNEILKKYKDINPYHYILHLFTFKIAFPIFLIITIGSDEPQDQYTQEFINLMQEKMKRYSRRLSNSISQECKKYLELIEKHKPS